MSGNAILKHARNNIVLFAGPGGYLQWQECDACDSWTKPETTMTRSTVDYVIAEKTARGLLPGLDTSRTGADLSG